MPGRQPPHTQKYRIGKSVEYSTRGFSREPSPAPAVGEFTTKLEAEVADRKGQPLPALQPTPTAEEPGRPREKHAVWIVHGMGQQVPFETLDSLTTGIVTAARNNQSRVYASLPRVAVVKFLPSGANTKEQVVQRVEIDLFDKDDPRKSCQLHLYEAYWAPVTEGAAKLADVFSFFFNGGMRGIWNAFRPFKRAMFPKELSEVSDDDMQTFRVPPRAVFEVLLTLVLLLSLIAINTVIVSAAAAMAGIPAFTMTSFKDHWPELSAMATAICAMALTFGVILFLAEMCKPSGLSKWQKKLITIVGWIGFVFTAAAIIVSAVLMSTVTRFQCVARLLEKMNATSIQGVSALFLLAAALLAVSALVVRGILRSGGDELHDAPPLVFLFLLSFFLHVLVIPALVLVAAYGFTLLQHLPAPLYWLVTSTVWVWPALIVLSKLVRTLLIQYPGDVAIYVDSNKLDRFCKIRQEIKQIAVDSVYGIYTARNAERTDFEYSRIAVVGHSLGSVIAYDTLNKLLNLDDIAGNPVGVERRTCILETFGSPLDKIAYFFTIQGKQTFHIREELAAVVQPLIQSYPKFRTFPWVNIFSPNDIISGSLQFYDLPDAQKVNRVQNIRDPDAFVPLAAHTDYWKNSLVWSELLERVGP